MADRYTYVPLLGLFVIMAWAGSETLAWSPRQARILALTVALVLGSCGLITARQLRYWRNSETLFRYAVQVTHDNFLAYCNLGLVLSGPEAIESCHAALKIYPDYEETHNNLGIALAMSGKLGEAIDHFHTAIRLKPSLASAHSNLGMALASQHKLGEAISESEESLHLKPDEAREHSNLGNVLDAQGKVEEAISHYRAALQLEPNNPDLHFNLGMTLAGRGKREERSATIRKHCASNRIISRRNANCTQWAFRAQSNSVAPASFLAFQKQVCHGVV